MKVIKRSKIAIISLIFMALIAGYINYKYNPEREKNLGQTVYVNGKDSFTYDNVSIYSEDKKDENSNNTNNESANLSTDSKSNGEDTLAVFKYDRDNMFSELSENYVSVIKNEKTSTEDVKEYQKKLSNLITEKNQITMVENVIKSNGIDNVVIIPTNNENINVIVSSKEELKKEDIAKIQQILVDQLNANPNKISITSK